MSSVDQAGRARLRMELVEFVSTVLSEEESFELFELAAADPQLFFTEIISRHRSGQLVLPRHLVKAVGYDLQHLDS